MGFPFLSSTGTQFKILSIAVLKWAGEFAAGKYNINVGDDIKGMVGDGTLKGIAGDISGVNISQNINQLRIIQEGNSVVGGVLNAL